ncbi:MAG TPA: HU family DNA-binding protein [bacterium]|nr:HU family DNA-binding protein [bacterium]
MNKAELVEQIAKETGASKAKVELGLKAAIAVITKELKKKGSVQLIGFGTFAVKERAARKGLNPATGEKIRIPKKKVPVFKAGAALKDAVAGKKKK